MEENVSFVKLKVLGENPGWMFCGQLEIRSEAYEIEWAGDKRLKIVNR